MLSLTVPLGKPPGHRSQAAGLLKSPLATPKHRHGSHKAPTNQCWVSHALLNGQSRLLASSCFLLENLQLFRFSQAVMQPSISVTSEY